MTPPSLSSAPLWRIQLLGQLRAVHGEQVVTRFRRQKDGALLAYIAYFLQRSHPREELIELLWPGCDPDAGRDRLSTALSALRRQLEPPGLPPGSILVADRMTVALNPVTVATDVAQFEAALQAAGRSRNPLEQRQWREEAVAGYQGELLPGYFEEWILPERERLTEAYRQALQALIQECERAGELAQAVAYARRLVAADPLEEAGQEMLIRLLVQGGEGATARRQYAEFARLLAEELGAEPEPALRALVEESGRSRLSPPLGAALPTAPAVPEGAAPPAAGSGEAAPVALGTVTLLLAESEAVLPLSGLSPELLARLRREVERRQGAVEAAHGMLLGVFPRASDALAAAVAGQHQRSDDPPPASRPSPLLRMALHTGAVEREAGHLQGLALEHAVRLLRVAHPGQILLSETTAALLRAEGEPGKPGVELADLGIYRLRDTASLVAIPERLFQANYPDMPRREFPPLRAEPFRRGQLPLQLTRFFGREGEITELRQWLLEPQTRLVTLTGPGGSGKTRLALAVAEALVERFHGAVWFVPLAEAGDRERSDRQGLFDREAESGPTPRTNGVVGGGTAALFGARSRVDRSPGEARRIVETVGGALDLHWNPESEPVEQVVAFLSGQPSLLLLDNFERLVEAGAPLVRTLLERVPTLICLVTSRMRLGLAGEREFIVEPLPTPPPAPRTSPPALLLQREGSGGEATSIAPEVLLRHPSVQLFVDRAQAVRPVFEVTPANAAAVAELCRRLEGLPLALELAAARASVLTAAQMLEQLSRPFDLLISRQRDAAPRHRSLRATLEWSYQLLTSDLQPFFARLSVFRGGWTLEAAVSICNAAARGQERSDDRGVLGRGEDSAGVPEPDPAASRPPSRRVLPTPADGEGQGSPAAIGPRRGTETQTPGEGALSGRGSGFALDYLETLRECSLVVAEETGAGMRYRMLETVREFAAEQLASEEKEELARRHAAHYRALTETAEPHLAGREQAAWLDQLDGEHDNLLAALSWCAVAKDVETGLRMAGAMARFWDVHGYWSEGRARLAALLEAASERTRARAKALAGAGMLAYRQADYAAARMLHEESLAIYRELDDRQGIAYSLTDLGNVAWSQGDSVSARTFHEESLAVARKLGDKRSIALTLHTLGNMARFVLEYTQARALLEESLAIRRELGDREGIADSLLYLGMIAHGQADAAATRSLFEESLAIYRELGDKRGIAHALETLGDLARDQRDYAPAQAFLEESLKIRNEIGDRQGVGYIFRSLGSLAEHQGDYAAAQELHETCLAIWRELGYKLDIIHTLGRLGHLARTVEDYPRALAFYKESLALRLESGDTLVIVQSLEDFATVAVRKGKYVRAAMLLGAAEALCEPVGRTLPVAVPEEFYAAVSTARSALGEVAFAEAWAEGRALSLQQAVTFAVEETNDAPNV